jgi:hypothetical protein
MRNPNLSVSQSLRARLHPRSGRYSVIFDGRLLVDRSRDPECDAARALLARGYTGTLHMLDGKTGKPRTIIDIERAAKLTVREDRGTGPRFVKWRPMPESARERCKGEAYSPESGGGGRLIPEKAA